MGTLALLGGVLAHALAAGPIAFVQENDGTTCGQPFTLQFQAPVQPGAAVVLAVNWDPGSRGNGLDFSDNYGNHYLAAAAPTPSVLGYVAAIYYAVDVDAGSQPFALSYGVDGGGSQFIEATQVEYQGFRSPDPVDSVLGGKSGTGRVIEADGLHVYCAGSLVFGWVIAGGSVQQPGTGFAFRSGVSEDLVEDEITLDAGMFPITAQAADVNWFVLGTTFAPAGCSSPASPGGGPLIARLGCSTGEGVGWVSALGPLALWAASRRRQVPIARRAARSQKG